MLRYFLAIAIFSPILLCIKTLDAQPGASFQSEVRFIQHMLSRGNQKEALLLLEEVQPRGKAQEDTLNYLTGWTLYGQKELGASAWYLGQVSRESRYWNKANFFAAYNYAYLEQTNLSLQLLKKFDNSSSSQVLYMKNFQKSGIALLDRRLQDYAYHAQGFAAEYSFLEEEEEKMADYYQQIKERRGRSGFVAALLSTAIPGLGKIYAGKTAEGISGFLYVGALGAASYDFHRRLGPQNVFFIISATLAGIFYVGNIWGSVVSVNRVENEFNHEINQRILLDLHIPLRKLFP